MVRDYIAEIEADNARRCREEEEQRKISTLVQEQLNREKERYGKTIAELFEDEEEAWHAEIDRHQDSLLTRLSGTFEELRGRLGSGFSFELTQRGSLTLSKETPTHHHEVHQHVAGAHYSSSTSVWYTFERYTYKFYMLPNAPNTLNFKVLYAGFDSDYKGTDRIVRSVGESCGQPIDLKFSIHTRYEEVYNITLPLPLPENVFSTEELRTLVNAFIADYGGKIRPPFVGASSRRDIVTSFETDHTIRL